MSISSIRQGAHQTMTVESLTACKNQLQHIQSCLENYHHLDEVALHLEEMRQEEGGRDVISLTDPGLNSNENIIQCISDITSAIHFLLGGKLTRWHDEIEKIELMYNVPTSIKDLTNIKDLIDANYVANCVANTIEPIFKNRLFIKECCSELDSYESVNSRIATLLTDTFQGELPYATLEQRRVQIENLSSLIPGLKTRLLSCESQLDKHTISAFLCVDPLVERCKRYAPVFKEIAISIKEAWFASDNIQEIQEKKNALQAKIQALHIPLWVITVVCNSITTKKELQDFIREPFITTFFLHEFSAHREHIKNLISSIEKLQKLTLENDVLLRTFNQYKTCLLELQEVAKKTEEIFDDIMFLATTHDPH